IVQIVAALDGHLVGSAEVKVFQLQYASASAAAKLINDLFGDQRARSGQQQQQPGGFFSNFFRPPGFGGSDRGGGGGGDRGGQNQNQGRQVVPVNASADDR